MEIRIDNKGFELGGHRFAHDFYWIDEETHNSISAGKSLSSGELCKWLFGKWANALRGIDAENSPMFLPFAPEDEWIECFRADFQDGMIKFTRVDVAEGGHEFPWNDIEGFITSPHEILDTAYTEFADFDKDELLAALQNPDVVDYEE